MSDQQSNPCNDYFRLRNVTPKMYNSFQPPSWILTELKEKKSNILDFGCGFGQMIRGLKELGYKNVYGIDISNEAVEYCLSLGLNVKKISDNLNELEKIPFDKRFDIVIASHVIEHIPKERIIETLYYIKNNVLQRDGILLISVPNAQSNTNCYWAYEDWTHTTLFTGGSLFYVLKAAGFETVEFLNVDCTAGRSWWKVIIIKFFLKLYRLNKHFWNIVTSSSYHAPSPEIYSYEIKAKATKR